MKNKRKILISIVFLHDLTENQLHYLEKWVMKKLWAFEVIFFLCVFVKKINFHFFLFFSIKNSMYPIYLTRKYLLHALIIIINSRKYFKVVINYIWNWAIFAQFQIVTPTHSFFKLNKEWAYSEEWYAHSEN